MRSTGFLCRLTIDEQLATVKSEHFFGKGQADARALDVPRRPRPVIPIRHLLKPAGRDAVPRIDDIDVGVGMVGESDGNPTLFRILQCIAEKVGHHGLEKKRVDEHAAFGWFNLNAEADLPPLDGGPEQGREVAHEASQIRWHESA